MTITIQPRLPHPLVLSSIILSVTPFATHWRLNQDVRVLRPSNSASYAQIIYWTLRSLWWRQPLPLDFESWYVDMYDENSVWEPQWKEMVQAWPLLEPLFATHGYYLYKMPNSSPWFCVPDQSQTYLPLPDEPDPYPFARTLSEAVRFYMSTPRLWAARDRYGRDVVIKLISDSRSPSVEWDALKRLNAPAVRNDPRNHVIYVLDFIEFNNFVFAVMPRWDHALSAEFNTVDEVLNMCYIFLEALTFIHDCRVAHADLLAQNICINSLSSDPRLAKGIYKPEEAKYAIYDFGAAFVYPIETPLDTVQETCWLPWTRRGLEDPDGASYSPFKADVLFLGQVLQRRARHLENIIPELGPFFDKVMSSDEAWRPMAQEAFDDFKELYGNVNADLRESVIRTAFWVEGKVRYRDGMRPDNLEADHAEEQARTIARMVALRQGLSKGSQGVFEKESVMYMSTTAT